MNRAEQIIEAMYSLGGGTMRKLGSETVLVQPNTVYWMGASTSPDQIFVSKVTPEWIFYYKYPFKTELKIDLPIGKDLIQRGTTMRVKMYGRTLPDEAKKLNTLLAGKSVKSNVKLQDLQKETE